MHSNVSNKQRSTKPWKKKIYEDEKTNLLTICDPTSILGFEYSNEGHFDDLKIW